MFRMWSRNMTHLPGSRWPILGVALLTMLLGWGGRALGADISLKPSLGVGEEYTDNVFETYAGKRTDFITHLRPNFLLSYQTPFWAWNLGYDLDYRYYAKGSRKDDATHNGSLVGNIKLVDEKLFLDLSETYKRVSLDTSRDTTLESFDQSQSNQNVATVSPWMLLRPTATTSARVGYRYVNTWYQSSEAVSKQENVGFLQLSYELMPRLSATAGYTVSRQDSDEGDSVSQTALAGVKYEHAKESLISVQAGYSWLDAGQMNSNHPFWSVAAEQMFDRTKLSLGTERKYGDDPLRSVTLTSTYFADLSTKFDRGSVGIRQSYMRLEELDTNTVQSDTYTTSLSGRYDLTARLMWHLNFTYDHIDIFYANGFTRRFLTDTGLAYQLSDTLSLSGTYKMVHLYSPVIPVDNKTVNRGILEIRKTF